MVVKTLTVGYVSQAIDAITKLKIMYASSM
jgi:hypothetical protein